MGLGCFLAAVAAVLCHDQAHYALQNHLFHTYVDIAAVASPLLPLLMLCLWFSG